MITNYSNTILWKDYTLSIELLLHFCQKYNNLMYVDLFLDSVLLIYVFILSLIKLDFK